MMAQMIESAPALRASGRHGGTQRAPRPRLSGEAIAAEMGRPGGSLARHPDDGWVLADPYPMSRGLVKKFHGVIRAMCPDAIDVPDMEVRIEQQVRRMMRYMQPLIARAFKVILRILDWAPIFRLRGVRRLHKLPPDKASAVLAGMSKSRFGLLGDVVAAARGAILAVYYDLPEVCGAVGYTPEPFIRQRIALRQQLMAGADGAAQWIGPFSRGTDQRLPNPAEKQGQR